MGEHKGVEQTFDERKGKGGEGKEGGEEMFHVKQGIKEGDARWSVELQLSGSA